MISLYGKQSVFFSHLTCPTGVWGSHAPHLWDSWATLNRFWGKITRLICSLHFSLCPTFLASKLQNWQWKTDISLHLTANSFVAMNHGDSFKATIWGLSAVTMITKEAKEPNNRVLLGALLFNCFVSFVVCNLCLGTYRGYHNIPRSQSVSHL